MDWLLVHFPVSGVDTYVFFPPLVMFVISLFTSMGGVSGAFVLLPFQMSVLGYTAPGVSATNFVYNIVAIPMGVLRIIREGRLAWSLFAVLMVGTFPGVFLGYYLRVTYLPQPGRFRLFAGLVLAYLGLRTLYGISWKQASGEKAPASNPVASSPRISGGRVGMLRTTIRFGEQTHSFPSLALFSASMVVGVIGGAYGIGGGALLAPFCISVLSLPPQVVSGATLSSTWVTSVVAALFYALVPVGTGVRAAPDWLLGALFGLGGMAGIYLGARLQRRFPTWAIRLILGAAVLAIAFKYIWSALD